MLALSSAPSYAHHTDESGYYDISATIIEGNVACVQVGGWTFDPGTDPDTGALEVPLSVKIRDAGSALVPWLVCQDPNDDTFCGDPGEPVVLGCGDIADLSKANPAFRADLQTTVFVFALGPLAGELTCTGVGTYGTIAPHLRRPGPPNVTVMEGRRSGGGEEISVDPHR